ncbi:twin-arginine translocase TatA/TatE family subunit [Microbacterium sp. Marseille-Q6965]|uniref:twin-arginine translocase TatA/TatE family subunit n=1 Tax=Microbacterium sp. Marseille-Q6965 TaxID=2965072 RepID=UPI0021B7903E|nr:twin-arginine translocase TatA/TatE family subunit [Microbacterium sp. Marseille-Q6965]
MEFGLSFEKIILIGVVAALLIGPERLPHYAELLGQFVRRARDWLQGAQDRVKREMGEDFEDVDWRKLDPRQYDPRRIIREALLEEPAVAATAAPRSAGAAAQRTGAGRPGAAIAPAKPAVRRHFSAAEPPPYDPEAT